MDIPNRRDIAVTGIGLVTPLGIGVGPVWEALMAGRSGIQSREPGRGGWIHPFAGEEHTSHPQVRRMTRGIQFGWIAGEMAVRDAGLDELEHARVVFGTTHPVTSFVEEFHDPLIQTGPATAPPMCFAVGVHNAVPFFLCEKFNIRDGSLTLVGTHAVGLDTLIHGCRLLGNPDTRFVLAGAATELTPTILAVYSKLGVTEVLGEGGVFMVLERIEDARSRGARIYATIGGWDSRGQDQEEGVAGSEGIEFDTGARTDIRGAMGEGFAFTSMAHAAVAALALHHQQVPLSRAGKAPIASACLHASEAGGHDNSAFVRLKKNG